jgi:bis(5'-nucleosidyl)-tetraphosphatase
MIDESWYRRPAGMPEHVAAGGVVVRVDNRRLYVALVGEDEFSTYILPKGHVEEGENLEEAARREIAEESGLRDLRPLAELGVRERMDFAKKGWKKTHYFLFLTGQTVGVPSDSKHRYRLAWFPLDEPLPLLWPEQKELIEANRERIEELVARATTG